jgi:hypothetical protein
MAQTLTQAAQAENLRRAQEGRPPLPVVPAVRLRNHGDNETWRPELALRPSSDIEQLCDIMRFLREAGAATIKAGGSRHSWSKAAASDGVYLHPEEMSFVSAVTDDARESAVLRQGAEARLENCFVIGSGTRIGEINDALWAKGKALPVLGGYDGQTLAGVVQTATHGSVLRFGPICDAVLAINLVDAQGQKWRIEPAAGPSDPAAFAAQCPDWTLRQEDGLFDAALVSAGMFGVVHSYVVRVGDAFHLRERRTLMKASELMALLRGGNIYRLTDVEAPPWLGPDDGRRLLNHPANVYHLEFLVNPHATDGREHTVVVTSRQIFDPGTPEPPQFRRTRADAKDLFRVLSQPSRFSRPALGTWIVEHAPWLPAALQGVVATLLPHRVPDLLDRGMKGIADEEFVGRSYNVFNIGFGQNNIPALSSEPSVPLRDDLYLDALQLILERAERNGAAGRFHTGPLSMRFVAGSKAMLADHEDVCRFEIIYTAGTRYAPDQMREYEDALFERFGGDVRPHWGQINNLNAASKGRLESMYPRLQAWKVLRQEFDPQGVFLNDWQRELF